MWVTLGTQFDPPGTASLPHKYDGIEWIVGEID
jgi:hypothetical protein